jgi:hypothetical protein
MVCFPHDPKCTPKNDGEKPEKEQSCPVELRSGSQWLPNTENNATVNHAMARRPTRLTAFTPLPTPARVLC